VEVGVWLQFAELMQEIRAQGLSKNHSRGESPFVSAFVLSPPSPPLPNQCLACDFLPARLSISFWDSTSAARLKS
jgi:hypothetical protein